MSNGKKCGKRSAYSKPGGYEPLAMYPILSAKKIIMKILKKNKNC